MAGDASQVLATREMIIYSAPWAASNVMPLDTIDYGAVTTPYVDLGWSDGGLGLTINVDRDEITVDQVLDPIYRPVSGRSVAMDTVLAQFTPANLQKAASMGEISTVAPGAGTKGHDDLSIDGDVPTDQYLSVLFETKQPNGEPLRAIIYKGIAVGSPAPRFGQSSELSGVAFEVDALVDSSTSPSRIALIRSVLPATA